MKKFSLLLLWTLMSLPMFAFGIGGGDDSSDTPTPTLTIELTDELRLSKVLTDLGYYRENPMMMEKYYAPIHELIITGKVYDEDFVDMNMIRELTTLNLLGSSVEGNSIPAQSFGFDDPNLFPFGNGTLTHVLLPSTITSIGNEAFIACGNLQSINLKDLTSLRTIGISAFKECRSLMEVDLPSTVTSIGNNAFVSCNSLKFVNIAQGNIKYISEDGVLYERSPKTMILYPSGKDAENVVVSEGTVALADYVLSNRYDLKSVTLANSVKSIGMSAFAGCSNLTSVNLGNSLEVIGSDAFFYSGLTSIDFPSTLKEIGSAAFTGNRKIESLVLPSSLEVLGGSAFSGCSALKSVDFSAITKLKEIAHQTFNNCAKLESVDLSGITSLITLSESCFAGCSSLERLEIPSSLRLLEFGALIDCKSLKSFDLKSVETVSVKAFLNCSSLTSLYIPSTMKTIGESAFAGCTSIESVEVSPESWDFEVVDGILYNNTENGRYIVFVPLNNPVEHIVLSQEVKEISNYSFAGNVHLKSITLAGNDILKIGDFAFAGCASLESVNFTGQLSRLEYIGESAFEDCSNFKGINFKGAVNLTTVGGLAFKNCSLVESFDFSDSNVQSYSYNSFAGCSSLKELKLNNSYEYLSSDIVEGCYDLKEILLSGAIQYSWNINSSAFANSGITNIIIGEGSKVFKGGGAMVTTNNGTQIFMVAPALTGRVEIPEGVISTSWGAFSSGPAIETLVLPSTFTGDVGSFSSLANLSSYEVHSANPIYSVKGGVLLNLQGDKLMSLPANIGVEFTTPEGVKTISSNAISENSILERFIGGTDLEFLDNNSLTNCRSLTSITLSENFKGFGDMAVINCDNLNKVTIHSTIVPSVGAYSFGWFMGQGVTFYVPDAIYSSYKAESSWDNYNVQQLSSTSSPEIAEDAFNVYVENGNVVVETSLDGAILTLYNLTGNIVNQIAVNANRTQLNMNVSGNAIVIASIVLNGERVFVKKLVL